MAGAICSDEVLFLKNEVSLPEEVSMILVPELCFAFECLRGILCSEFRLSTFSPLNGLNLRLS